MKLRKLSCHDTTQLVLDGQDRRLSFTERWLLRGHLKICTGCGRFVDQVGTMREAMARWRSYRDPDDDGA